MRAFPRIHPRPLRAPSPTIPVWSPGQHRTKSRVRRLATAVYNAQAGSRWPLLDGPWRLALTLVVALGVLAFGGGPWRWLALLVVLVFFLVPLALRWAVALGRSVRGR